MSVDELRPHLRQLATIAREHLGAWMAINDPGIDDLRQELAGALAPYTESAALLAADWYREQNTASRFDAAPVALITEQRLDNTAKWIFCGPQTPESRARQCAGAMVFDAARNTVLVNAGAEGVAIARHAQASACHDCIARSTLVEREKHSSSDDVARDFHHSCSCLYVPVRNGVYTPPDYTRDWRSRVDAARRAGNHSVESVANWLAAH